MRSDAPVSEKLLFSYSCLAELTNSFSVECGLTSHAHCTHLVPDFCGMSMEAANQILETLIRTRHHINTTSVSTGLSNRTLRPGGPPQPPQDNAALSYPQKPKEGPYGALPRQPSAEAVSAATNSYMTPQSPTAIQQAVRQPLPPKSPAGTGEAIAAATSSMRSPTQQISGMYSPRCSFSRYYLTFVI